MRYRIRAKSEVAIAFRDKELQAMHISPRERGTGM
jgi:hypothetical protein